MFAMEKCIELVSQLPDCIIYSPDLWHIAVEKFPVYLNDLVYKSFAGIKELTLEHYVMLDNVVHRENSAPMLCDAVMNNETEIIFAVRTYILNKHIERIQEIAELFYIELSEVYEITDVLDEVLEYLMNMIEAYPSKIHLSWEDVKHVFESYGDVIWKEHAKLFQLIRNWACERFKDDMVELKTYFKAPYPLISSQEMRYISLPESVFELYDATRADIDNGDAFVEFCNRQFRKSDIAFAMFRFVATMDDEMIPIVFYKLNMQKVRFSIMSLSKKLQVVEELRIPLELNDSEEIVRFMDFTECLIPDLENEILPDLKKAGNDILCKAYIKAIQKYGKITKETLKNLRSMPKIYMYGDMINQEMYKRKYYKYYVCSKNLEDTKLVIEYDKMDVLWSVYLQIFRTAHFYEYTRKCMCESKEFLRLVQNRNAYQDLPEDSRMAMASILQDENTLTDVLGYSDEFVVEYFSKIDGFSSKKAAETFVEIMEKNQKYAQNKAIYDNVYDKLGNAQLKSKYTRLYNRANG